MESHFIDNAERTATDEETHTLINRRQEIVKPGEYRMSGNRWKRYHPPRYLRTEQTKIEQD